MRSRSGFSLIEVLVALFLLVTGIAVLSISFSRGLAVVKRVEGRGEVRSAIEQVRYEFPLDPEVIEDSELDGDLSELNFRWERSIDRFDEEVYPGLFLVNLSIWQGDIQLEWSERFVYRPDDILE